jgi:DNA-binding SARP family transcriptional activator
MARVEIRLLGRFGVSVAGTEVPYERFGGRRTRTLVAILATARGELIPKDVLVEALWGDAPPANPAGNVDVLASRARRALGEPSLLRARSGGLVLAPDERVGVDAERFSAAVERGRNYLAAQEVTSASSAFGEALATWAEPLPEERYGEWAEPFRRRIAELHLEALEGGARAAMALGNASTATRLAGEAAGAEPLREVSNLLLVTALAQGGDQAGALRAFHAYRTRLREELGLDPSSEAYEVQASILQGARRSAVATLGALLPDLRVEDPRAVLTGRGGGPMRARTLASLAMLAAGSDDYARAGELVELALVEAGADARALAESLYVASIVDMNLGSLERAERRADEALGHFERLGDTIGVANIIDGRAMATFMAGRVSEAVSAFDRVARLFEDSDDLARVITPRSTRGHGLVFMGRPDDGLLETEGALELAVSLGDREGEAYARWHRTEALAALGRSDEAVASARTALGIAEQMDHREWTAAALRALAIALTSAGDLDRAEEVHRRGLEASTGIPLFTTWHAAGLALTLLGSHRPDEARPMVELALEGGPPLGTFEARLAEIRLARATDDPRAGELARDLARDADDVGYEAIALGLRSPAG